MNFTASILQIDFRCYILYLASNYIVVVVVSEPLHCSQLPLNLNMTS